MLNEFHIDSLKAKYEGDKFDPEKANEDLQTLFECFIENNLMFKDHMIGENQRVNGYVESIRISNMLAMAYATEIGLYSEILRISTQLYTCKENTKEYKDLLEQKRLKEIEKKNVEQKIAVLKKESMSYSRKLKSVLRRKKRKYNFFGWKYKLNKYIILTLVLLSGFGVELLIDSCIGKLDDYFKEEKIKLFSALDVFVNKISTINFYGIKLIHLFFFVIAYIFMKIWWEKRSKKISLKLHKRNFEEGIQYLEQESKKFYAGFRKPVNKQT